jgi:hypothetical protein
LSNLKGVFSRKNNQNIVKRGGISKISMQADTIFSQSGGIQLEEKEVNPFFV